MRKKHDSILFIVTEFRIAVRIISFYLEPDEGCLKTVHVKWVAETFSRRRILLAGEDKRAFRLPVFVIFASWRETWTRITWWWCIDSIPMHPWTSMFRATIYYKRFPSYSWREWMFEAMVLQIMTHGIASNNLFYIFKVEWKIWKMNKDRNSV